MAVTDVDAKYKMLALLFNSKGKTKTKIPTSNIVAEFSGTISPGGTSGTNNGSGIGGMFQTSRSSVNILQMTVQKMQAAINAPLSTLAVAKQPELTVVPAQPAVPADAQTQPPAAGAQASPAPADTAAASDAESAEPTQAQTNRRQADSIVNQLGYPSSNAWAIYSMADDLAVFGRDMTALNEAPEELAGAIRTRAQEMLAGLDEKYAGGEGEGDFIKERNRITGAAARLANGLEGARPVIAATSSSGASASWSIAVGGVSPAPATVKVDGVNVDASVVVSVSNVIVDPLVLDMNGDGIALSSAEAGVDFDMDADGSASRTAFVQGDDAFLAMDSHADGRVHDGSQLFGNQGGHANGFDHLARYDDNADGRIDAEDAVYDKLMLWRELNENGVTDEGETVSLREAGIAAIELGYENGREDDGKGNLISQKGAFTRTDGSRGLAADVWLRETAEQGGAQTNL